MKAATPIERLLSTSAELRGCPCGAKHGDGKDSPTLSVVMQLATLGNKRRLRARAVTVHCCARCVRLIMTNTGRALRVALANALQLQAVDLQRQHKESNAA
jgi:hypothetical protein